MKKNLRIVLGLVFLFYTFASCESDDELNALQTSDSPVKISEKHQVELEESSFDKEQIEEQSCGEIESTTLYAGQDIDVGWIHISNSEGDLYVTYDLSHTGWSLQETHLFVGSEEDIPYTQSGSPKIGHFPYHAQQDDETKKEYTYVIPAEDLPDCLVIIAHAVVEKDDDARRTETAFGYDHDNEFPGNRWGWFIDYCLQECEDPQESGDSADGNDSGDNGDNGENGSNGDDGENGGNGDTGDSGDGGDSGDSGDTGGSSGGTNDGSTPDDSNTNPNTGDQSADCLVSYAFNSANQSDSHCFLNDGFDQWGWSNQVFYSQEMNYVTGYIQNYPLLASAYQCDISNSLEVGYVRLKVTGGDGRFFAEMEVVITDSTYDLQDFDLYVGTAKYPVDGSMNPTVQPEFYTYNVSSIGAKTYVTTDPIPWPYNSYFIARASICPAN